MKASTIVMIIATVACTADKKPSHIPDDTNDGDSDPILDSRYRNLLESPTDYAALQAETGGEVKYLFQVDGRTPVAPLYAQCYFQDMHQFDWHMEFLNSFTELADLTFDDYLAYMMRSATRVWWGGAVKIWPAVPHPDTAAPGIVSYWIYADPNNLTADDIIEIDQIVKNCVAFARDLLVYVPSDPAQKSLTLASTTQLQNAGVSFLMPEQLLDGIPSESYSLGEGYGTLRIVPQGEPLGTHSIRDVVIVQSAPNDISIVAGLVTADPQNLHSHVNLRLQEKGIPNAAVPAIYDNEYVKTLDNFLVHLVVTDTDVNIEPARLEDAEAFWETHRPPVSEPTADLSVSGSGTFVELGTADADAYGAKAANIAELYDILPAQNRVDGFGIPFSHYRDFIVDNGVDLEIDAMLFDPRMQTNAEYKKSSLKLLRQRIRGTPLDAAFFTMVQDQMRAVFGVGVDDQRIRFRSSTNVEDLEVFTGAGLYDSRSGCLADDLDGDDLGPSLCLSSEERTYKEALLAQRQQELIDHPERTWLVDIIIDIQGDLANEKPVAKAIRRVWSSLWNVRAFDEREYYGIDHRDAYMGIAVNPTFIMEQASAVAITNLIVDTGDPLYRVVSQAGEESVVRPDDPLAIAEVMTFRRTGDPATATGLQVLIYSSLMPASQAIWVDPNLTTLTDLLFLIQDHFATNVYSGVTDLHLDAEIKMTQDDRVVFKQVRPYLVNGP